MKALHSACRLGDHLGIMHLRKMQRPSLDEVGDQDAIGRIMNPGCHASVSGHGRTEAFVAAPYIVMRQIYADTTKIRASGVSNDEVPVGPSLHKSRQFGRSLPDGKRRQDLFRAHPLTAPKVSPRAM